MEDYSTLLIQICQFRRVTFLFPLIDGTVLLVLREKNTSHFLISRFRDSLESVVVSRMKGRQSINGVEV